jgi:cyclic lactone autoinducer peptide
MKNGKFRFIKITQFLAMVALFIGVNSASTDICTWWFHQPKVPKEMDKFKKY